MSRSLNHSYMLSLVHIKSTTILAKIRTEIVADSREYFFYTCSSISINATNQEADALMYLKSDFIQLNAQLDACWL